MRIQNFISFLFLKVRELDTNFSVIFLTLDNKFESVNFIVSKYVLSATNTGHMINRKGGQPNQGICHKVKDGSGKFDCPIKNMTIFAVTTNKKPSLFIKTSG